MSKRLPMALLVAASVIVAAAVAANSNADEPERSPRPVAESHAASGLEPIAEVVTFFSQRVVDHPQDYVSRTQLGSALVALARETGNLLLYEQAEEVFEEALDLNPRYESALLGIATTRIAQHDFAGALAIAQDVWQVDQRSLSALALIGDAQLESGDYDGASAAYEELAQERTAPVVSRLARLAFIQGRPEEALDYAREALAMSRDLDLRPVDAAFYLLQAGHYLYELGKLDEAADMLTAALDSADGHLGSRELLARVQTARGRMDDALRLYEGLLATNPAADLHGEVAKLHRIRSEEELADEHVEEGLALARRTIDRFPAERRHVAMFLADHEPRTALQLAQADFAVRQDVYAYDTLAWTLYVNGRYEEALDALRGALNLDTVDAELFYHAGMIHYAVGDFDGARVFLAKALELNPGFDPLYAPIAAATLKNLGSSAP